MARISAEIGIDEITWVQSCSVCPPSDSTTTEVALPPRWRAAVRGCAPGGAAAGRECSPPARGPRAPRLAPPPPRPPWRSVLGVLAVRGGGALFLFLLPGVRGGPTGPRRRRLFARRAPRGRR